jgi:hypothetical protein
MLSFLTIGEIVAMTLLICAIGLGLAIKREKSFGYTTLFDSRRKALWQFDPEDGTVVRRPGESQAPTQKAFRWANRIAARMTCNTSDPLPADSISRSNQNSSVGTPSPNR